jgi:hypothetical protein
MGFGDGRICASKVTPSLGTKTPNPCLGAHIPPGSVLRLTARLANNHGYTIWSDTYKAEQSHQPDLRGALEFMCRLLGERSQGTAKDIRYIRGEITFSVCI